MKKFRWQLIIIFLTGLVVGILLLSEQPTPQEIPATPVPETGGVYVEALVGSMQRLNPLLAFYNQADRDVNRLIYSSLLRFDDRGLPYPELAEAWGVSQDGTVFNFKLYDNVTWHDGAPLTSEDIAFTVDLIKKGGTSIPKDLQDLWKDVTVVVFNDTTIQFRLPEAFAPFQDYLTFGILPKHIFGQMSLEQIAKSDLNLKPVGSGPYKVDRILAQDKYITGVVLSIYDGYFKSKPFIEQIQFKYFADDASAWKAYQDGEVQGISRVGTAILPNVLATNSLSVYSSRLPEVYWILLNHKDAEASFLKEPAIRKALMIGLNRTQMINRLLKGQAILAEGPIFPESWAYYANTEKYSFDLDKAKNILKDAGYMPASDKDPIRKKGNTALSFELLYPDEGLFPAIADQIAKDWLALGIQVTVKGVSYEEMINDRLDPRSYQAALINLNFANTYDPDPYPFWDQAQATGGQNYTQWDSRIGSEFIEQARMTVDFNERVRLYRSFQVLFAQELPALPLFYPVYTYAIDQQIQGVQVGPFSDPSDRFSTITQWFLVSKKSQVTPSPTSMTTP